MRSAVKATFDQALQLFTPPERLSPCQWAERNLWLTRGTTSKPGLFKPYPWQVEVINAVIDPRLNSVALQWPAQLLGKSTAINTVIAWSIAASPAPMLLVHPSVESAETFSKNKLSPLILDSPVLSQLVQDEELKFRRKGAGAATVSLKRFPGGFLVLVGANASTGLRSHSCKRLFFDEVSAFPQTVANDEGDPVWIAIKRSETFSDSFTIMSSTPTIVESCRISLEMADTDQREWFVTCPACGQQFVMHWSDVEWRKDKGPDGKTLRHYPETAGVRCPACRAIHDDQVRQQIALAGHWRATNPQVTSRAGFRANGLISVQAPKRGYVSLLHQFAEEYLRAVKRGTYFVRTFQNSVLAEAYNPVDESLVQPEVLCDRRYLYPETGGEIIIPANVRLLVIGADVQRDRIEAELLGIGENGETWGIEYRTFRGSTEQPEVFKNFDKWCLEKHKHASGWLMWAAIVAIDSAFKSESVYRHCRSCADGREQRVYAVRGDRGWAPVGANWVEKSPNIEKLWLIKVDGLKESLYARLQIEAPGPGFQHFPKNLQAGYDAFYFKMLTSEILKTTAAGTRYFAKPNQDTRNEALDCRVYAEAAVAILNPDFEAIAKQLASDPPSHMSWEILSPAQSRPEAPAQKSINEQQAIMARITDRLSKI